MWKTNPRLTYSSVSKIPLAPCVLSSPDPPRRTWEGASWDLLLFFSLSQSPAQTVPGTTTSNSQTGTVTQVLHEFQAEYKVLILEKLAQYSCCLC